MTFRFPYEHILSLKEKEKEQAFSEYGSLVKKKDQLKEEIHGLLEEQDEQINRSNGMTSVVEMQQQSHYLNLLIKKIAQAKEVLSKIDEELRVKQEKYMEKHKDERMWNFLRDKSFDAFLQKEKKVEQDQLDELAVIRHFHQRFSH
ncbi:flagellar export protein FliJ [Neobacillus novalis]|uniref:Flagellar FliJ protein n=1 Tax=Neobacillus novalis TaxID=220687 RepID=A0AA95SEP0_9BACI|nr:flagellar export protein FliJ [Neobacillus novalis]WHY88408.1 flagellar export protein FliJ [Neobacillus novalis]